MAVDTVLADFKVVGKLGGFDPKGVGGVDKMLHGQEGVLVGLKKLSKVYLIPEEGLGPFRTISSFSGVKDFLPQDVYLVGNTLYVLDYKLGVFIYTLLQGNYS